MSRRGDIPVALRAEGAHGWALRALAGRRQEFRRSEGCAASVKNFGLKMMKAREALALPARGAPGPTPPMNTSAFPKLRRLLRGAGALVLAVLVSVSFTGCFDLLTFFYRVLGGGDPNFHVPLMVQVAADEFAKGSTELDATVTYTPALPVIGSISMAPASLAVSVLDEDGVAPLGVTVTPASFAGASMASPLAIKVTVGNDASARPFKIVLSAFGKDSSETSESGLDENYHYRGSAFVFVRNAGGTAAPRLTGVEGNPEAGGTLPVGFLGNNFDSTATFAPVQEVPGMLLTDIAAVAAGHVTANLTLPENVPTGLLDFTVTTAAGQSNRARLIVTRARANPVLHGVFPNYAAAGRDSLVQFAGEDFLTGMIVDANQPENLLDGSATTQSAFLLNQTFHPMGATRTEPVRVNSLGRLTAPADFLVKPAGFIGPRIKDITTPDRALVGGALNPVVFEWLNMDNQETPAVIAQPISQHAQPIVSARLFPSMDVSPGRLSHGVLDVAPVTAADTIYVAVENDDGLVTNLIAMTVTPPNPAKPFIRGAVHGRIARGGEVIDTVIGERLTGVNFVNFSTSQVQAEILPGTVTDTSFQMRVRSGGTTPLTGDRASWFEVRTPAGFSNHAIYRFERSDSAGGNPAIIDRVAPNWVYSDAANGSIHLLGANFVDGTTEAIFTPAGAVASSDVNVEDRLNADVQYELGVGTLPAAIGLTISTTAGQTSAGTIAVLDRATQTGPEPATFAPQLTVRHGIRTQISVASGDGLFNAAGTTIVWLPQEFSGTSNVAGTFFPQVTVGAPVRGVIEFDPFLATGATQVAGRFMLVRADGLTSRAVPITILAAPASGPVVRRVVIGGSTAGTLPPGQARSVRLEGVRLDGATAILINAPGVTQAGMFSVSPDGTEILANFTADPTATLTGDGLTTCQVVTPAGTSPSVSFIVAP